MSKYDPVKYKLYYEKHKLDIATRKKLARKKPGTISRRKSRERWANMTPEQKAIALEKRREFWKKYKETNPEKVAEKNRKAEQKRKEKKLRQYAKQLKYERTHKNRHKKYYEANKERILEQQRLARKIISSSEVDQMGLLSSCDNTRMV